MVDEYGMEDYVPEGLEDFEVLIEDIRSMIKKVEKGAVDTDYAVRQIRAWLSDAIEDAYNRGYHTGLRDAYKI